MAGENEIALPCGTDAGRPGNEDGVGQPVRGNFPHLLPNNSHGNEVTVTVSGG